MDLVTWFEELRPKFLLLTILIVSIGGVSSFNDGYFDLSSFVLCLLGVLSLHVAVNVLNDYHDFKSGIDLKTVKTPFSGGSGILPSGRMSLKQVYLLGISSLFLGVVLGIYFTFKVGVYVLPLVAFAAFSAYFYSPLISKVGLGEVVTGLNFGPIMTIGSYLVISGVFSLKAFLVGLPAGILTSLLLLVNEIPDVDADRSGGRRTLPILLGVRNAFKLYCIGVLSAYLIVVLLVFFGVYPSFTLISLASALVFIRILNDGFKVLGRPEYVRIMGLNVLLVLLTDFLLIFGYLIDLVL